MFLALVVMIAVAAPDAPADSTLHSPTKSMLAQGVGTLALGVGSAVGAWVDRDGAFGRACAITGGSLGTAALSAYLAAAVVALTEKASPIRDLSQSIAALVGAVAGLVVGVLVSITISTSAGTRRGVLGVAGGTVAGVGGAHLIVLSLVGPFSD